MLKKPQSQCRLLLLLHTTTTTTTMSLRPSHSSRSRGFSNRPYFHNHSNPSSPSPPPPPDYTNNNNPTCTPPPPSSYSFRPNNNPSFLLPNPYHQFQPPPPHFNNNNIYYYNQNQHFPHSHFNHHFLPPPPFYNQQQQQRFRRPVSDYRIWEHAKPPTSSDRFTVLSYNILADYLAINHRTKLYSHIPPHILDWNFRLNNILFELRLWSPDILCLQEVDRFHDLHRHLNIQGYNAIWKMRTGDPVDGCAIFWRSSRFKLLHEEAIEFNKFGLRDNVAQICRNKVVICNIHVLYNPKRGDIKLGQVSSLYNYISEQKLNLSELPRDKISGQYTAEIRPKGPFTSNYSQSPTTVDNKGELPSTLATDTTHKDEKTAQLEDKEEREGSSANCTSEILENMSSVVITDDNKSDVPMEAIDDASVGEDSTSFLSELHGPDGTDMADGADVADSEPFVENQNPFYDPSGWTPMEIEAATGSSECMTMEHHLKLRSTYTEVEDHSGSRDSNGEPQVTSYHRGFQGTVDYIWRSEGLQTVRVLAPIPKKAMEWTRGFPTKKWGSDHIALVAELAFSKVVDEEKSQFPRMKTCAATKRIFLGCYQRRGEERIVFFKF
ncbi:hypothetical protein M8C21_015320 [Ambrosia artemisiifolia]|uniref:Endonuclease/exonuclease/phosphatase domain-containing protein n=1 Tax=Ambrosia artemisiifolia TaxID=4212 RepID=A0AAD5C949_AMBAR|nr:hypothetical protein M8C21_015320 [Ambrosia artemisiifolia]